MFEISQIKNIVPPLYFWISGWSQSKQVFKFHPVVFVFVLIVVVTIVVVVRQQQQLRFHHHLNCVFPKYHNKKVVMWTNYVVSFDVWGFYAPRWFWKRINKEVNSICPSADVTSSLPVKMKQCDSMKRNKTFLQAVKRKITPLLLTGNKHKQTKATLILVIFVSRRFCRILEMLFLCCEKKH